jgi:hypothetical protein
MAYAPTITQYLDAAPMPRVEVLFTSFAAGTATVTVYRLGDGREYKMRGAVRAIVAGALTRIDTEVPFGIPVAYRAEMFNAAGLSLGFTDSTETTVNVAETWMHNPLDPKGGVAVAFRDNALNALSRPVMGDVYYPQGRRVGVVISGQRSGLRGVVLDVITDTVADADKVRGMLGDYSASTVPVLCFRVGAGDRLRIPRPLFAAVMDVQESDMNYVIGGTQITHAMKGDEVSPPAPGLFVPLLRRADLNAFYATRAALNADNLSRLSVNRRYDLAGTAP